MKKHSIYWLLILTFVLLFSACTGNSEAGAPGDMPVGEVPQEVQSTGDGVAKVLQGKYDFEMSAAVDGLVADMAYDQLTSDWWGEFSVDAEGLMTGVGFVNYDAMVFAVDDDLCGFSWTEVGNVEFKISGSVLEKDTEVYYPLKLFLFDPQVISKTEAEPTCDDPQNYLSQTPSQYHDIHRDALLTTVLTHLHQTIGDKIQVEETFTGQSGTVDYTILISLGLEDLD